MDPTAVTCQHKQKIQGPSRIGGLTKKNMCFFRFTIVFWSQGLIVVELPKEKNINEPSEPPGVI